MFGGQRTHTEVGFGGCSDDLHFFPVVWKLLATVQTHHVGSGKGGCRVSTGTGTNCDRKTAVVVPTAAKEAIEKFRDHVLQPQFRVRINGLSQTC